jgi:hypothetical protein
MLGDLPLNIVQSPDSKYVVVASQGLTRPTFTVLDVASWTVKRGSAQILVALARRDPNRQIFLRVVSPVMTMPEPEKREALYVRLLELNANGLGNSAFGKIGERIVALSERPTEGLDQGEVEQIIRQVSAVADTFDDKLVADFGGARASDA